MDFQIQLAEETHTFDQYQDLLNFMHDKIASWNNFTPEQPLYICIKKVPSDTPTLGVHVADDIDAKALLGGQQ